MTEGSKWEGKAARLLRTRLAAAGVTIEELALILSASGPPLTAQSIRSRLSRGTFSAAFLMRALDAIECHRLDLIDL